MRALLQGDDDQLEAALGARGLELVRSGDADALITLGPRPQLRRLDDLSPAEWTARFHVWAEEPFWALQAWLRERLRKRAPGRWLAITSSIGAVPLPGGGADGAAVVALHTLVRVTAAEYGARGVTANAIAAGWRPRTLPAALDHELALADTPSRRLVSETDLAATAAWLLSDDSELVNGEILRVDGGYTITRGSRPDPRTR